MTNKLSRFTAPISPTRHARDTADACDEESRSIIYFDKLLSERFLTISFGPLRMIPALDFWRMENGEGYIISPFPLTASNQRLDNYLHYFCGPIATVMCLEASESPPAKCSKLSVLNGPARNLIHLSLALISKPPLAIKQTSKKRKEKRNETQSK
jgi:hypothetical protein